MAELKCPHCGQAFTVDDTELSSIVQQIRDKEFEKDIEKRISELKDHMMMTHRLEMEAKENEIKLMSQKEYDKEIQKLKSQLEKVTDRAVQLQAQLDSSEDKKTIAVMEAVKKVEEEKKELEKINDDNKEVTVDWDPIKLTPIEYNILLLLVKNAGKGFSIDEIYEQIWNEEAIGADNTVAVHIRHIREKIEINPREPKYLKVVWGVGYKIEKQ